MNSLIPNAPSMFTIHKELDGDTSPLEFADKEQLIGILIGPEEFLLPILSIREIIILPDIAYVPNAPQLIEGVINLRGSILPVISMRKIMGMNRPESIRSSRVVIARKDDISMGMIVDGITHVVSLRPKDIQTQNLPRNGIGTEFIGSVCKLDENVRGIIDLNKIMETLRKQSSSSAAEQTSPLT